MSLRFDLRYFIGFLIVLMIEISIAIFLKTGFIRHSVGDVLAVVLIYCLVKSMIKANSLYVALGCLGVAFIIEFLQNINLLARLNLEDHVMLKLILGNTFTVNDLLAYLAGFIIIIVFEYLNPIT